MISYDPAVIRTFAQTLYDRAATIMFVYTAIGVVIGGTTGKFAFGNTGMFILAGLAGGIGYFIGSQRAFLLKLQAQTALCQVQIEQNTQSLNQEVSHITSPTPPKAKTSAPSTPTVSPAPIEPAGPMGTCPNCSALISLAAQDCPKCNASFGVGSAWKIVPQERPGG